MSNIKEASQSDEGFPSNYVITETQTTLGLLIPALLVVSSPVQIHVGTYSEPFRGSVEGNRTNLYGPNIFFSLVLT